MLGAPNLSPGVVVVALLLAALFSPARAHADASVSIHYASDAELELARRVASELASEGYTVDMSSPGAPSPCDLDGPKLVSVPRGTKAWIRLASDPSNPETVVASICYLGAQPFLQQTVASGPLAEGQKLALATAEALNGLRSRLPPLESDPARAPPREETPAPAHPKPPAPAPRPIGLFNSAALGAALMWNLPDFPLAPGIAARATLGLGPALGIAIDTFVPTTGQELTSEAVTATLRTSWIRVGPRYRGAAGDFDLSIAALAGPALTWATAVASPPRVGTTDVTTGAVLTLSGSLEYPRQATVFACASAAASALLPGVRVNLGESASAPRGSFPVEASIGIGARWGATGL